MSQKTINANFYDIESLSNVFTLANYQDRENNIDLYLLCDDDALTTTPGFMQMLISRIYQCNRNFNGTVTYRDLKRVENVWHMASTFGLSDQPYINDPNKHSNGIYPPEFRIVCDTDPDYDPEKHPYFFGYNSYNYDTTILTEYLSRVFMICMWGGQQSDGSTFDPRPTLVCRVPGTTDANGRPVAPVTAADLRAVNDDIFDRFRDSMPSYLARTQSGQIDFDDPRWITRKNMLMTGRHLDVARLNEKQSKVALKRLLGMLGYQIFESDKLGSDNMIETTEQLCDLIAYNVSDVVNLKHLFYHSSYKAQFDLKMGLLATYPELIYDKLPGDYKPNVSPFSVRRDRLIIDDSSAKFATKSLCPYGTLTDIPVVSFDYPHPEKAKELGIPTVNVLEESRKFFYRLYPRPDQQAIRDRFDIVYGFYKSIEGKNFNNSKAYAKTYSIAHGPNAGDLIHPLHIISEIPKTNTCLPYFDADGNITSCFALFGVGGIHGAEYNKELYEHDHELHRAICADMDEAQGQFPDPVDLRKAKKIIMADGRELPYTVFLKSGLKIAESQYRDVRANEPQLFKPSKGGYQLNPKYNYTSAAQSNHEDFKSYYPNLLRMMMAFYNEGLGYDRYAEIFFEKERYGKLIKDKSTTPEDKARYVVLQKGTKLILNAASGAADATFENNIRVNNQIISMRIIGQLFSWRIGQAQTFGGARMISTNTDGLYSVLDEAQNTAILAKESADIGVEIEPEPLYLISKDSNNRMEVDLKTGDIIGSSGGTLGCRKGPNPERSLSHPAIIDWALAEYLYVAATGYKGLSLDQPFDAQIGMNILQAARSRFDPTQVLLLFQNIIASSPSSITFIFGLTDSAPTDPIVLQHYNRMFIVKDGTPGTMHLWAAHAKVITPAMRKKRQRESENGTIHYIRDQIGTDVLLANGAQPPSDKDVVTKKVTGINPEWYIRILNQDMHIMPAQERDELLDSLDYEKYLTMLKTSYENNWMNRTPNMPEIETEDDDGGEDDE